MRTITVAATALSLMLTGCSRGTIPGASPTIARDMLTHEQLAATSSDNLYDAIAKLRPEWLTSRGPTSVSDPTPTQASVYMNGSMLGKADYLREMRVLDVSEVRYWEAGRAAARFGMGHPRGVIEVIRD
jgi:hypothetical protein